jgi:hypothetical protein
LFALACSDSGDDGADEIGESMDSTASESSSESSDAEESSDSDSSSAETSVGTTEADTTDVDTTDTDTTDTDTTDTDTTGDGDGDGDVPNNPCDEPPAGTLFHVAPDGTDNGICSEAEPCLTLQHAADVVDEPGATVLVAAGNYKGFHTVHPFIRFEAAGPGVIVDEEHDWDGDPAPDNINVENTDGVWIVGFEVRDAERAGIRVVESDDVIVCNNEAGPNGRWGIFTGFANRIEIVGNHTFDSGLEHGIYVSNSDVPDDDPIIRYNESHGNGRNGIQLNGDCFSGGDGVIEGAWIEGNEVWGNTNKGFSIIAAAEATIIGNLSHGNGLGGAAGGIHMTNEPGCDDSQASSDGIITGNTIVEPDIAAFRATDGATNNRVFGNILISPSGAVDEVGGNHVEFNLLADDETGVFEMGSWMPTAGGPAHDAGVDMYMGAAAAAYDYVGTMRPQGAAWDLGALERLD